VTALSALSEDVGDEPWDSPKTGVYAEVLFRAAVALAQFRPQSIILLKYDETTGSLRAEAHWGRPEDAARFLESIPSHAWIYTDAMRRQAPVYPATGIDRRECPRPADVFASFSAAAASPGGIAVWFESVLSAERLKSAGESLRRSVTEIESAGGGLRRIATEMESALPPYGSFSDPTDLAALARIGETLASAPGQSEALTSLTRETRALVNAERVTFWLLENSGDRLIAAATCGSNGSQMEETRIPARAGIVGWVLETGQPAVVRDVENDARYCALTDGLGNGKTRSLVSVPIVCTGRVAGVIEAVSSSVVSFVGRDVDLLKVLAGYAALIMENARLREAEQELHRLATAAQAQLAQNDRLSAIGHLTASLAHELNNPLHALHNSLEVILSFPLKEEEKDAYLQMADEEVSRLIEMVNRILEYARRPSDEMKVTNLNMVTQRVLLLAGKYLQHQRIRVELWLADALPDTLGNPARLGQVLLNLIVNAAEAMPAGGTLSLTTEENGQGGVLLRVSDTGQGMAPETLARLFEPFCSTKEKGTGLGLSISKQIVAQHGGSISVQSSLGVGTQFEVHLPALSR
jgi:signal transduction histidine kinase